MFGADLLQCLILSSPASSQKSVGNITEQNTFFHGQGENHKGDSGGLPVEYYSSKVCIQKCFHLRRPIIKIHRNQCPQSMFTVHSYYF